MDILIELLLIIGLVFLLIKNIKAIRSITYHERKSKSFKLTIAFIFLLLSIIEFYFSKTFIHYLLTLLGVSLILSSSFTSGISTSSNKFIHNDRREVLFLSFPEEVDINNIKSVEITDPSDSVFSITYFFNNRYNKLYFSKKDKKQLQIS